MVVMVANMKALSVCMARVSRFWSLSQALPQPPACLSWKAKGLPGVGCQYTDSLSSRGPGIPILWQLVH